MNLNFGKLSFHDILSYVTFELDRNEMVVLDAWDYGVFRGDLIVGGFGS